LFEIWDEGKIKMKKGRIMRKFNNALLGAALLAGTALSSATAVAYEEESVFNGFYIGAQIGYGMTDMEINENIAPGVSSGNMFADGLLGGVFAGYGFMSDRVYFGLEADFEYSDVDQTNTIAGEKIHAEKDYGFSVGGRLGYEVVDNAIAYVRLGYNGSKYEAKYTTAAGVPTSDDDWLNGFELGAGAEMAIHDNVTMRLEYKHTFFDSLSKTAVAGGRIKLEPSENKVVLGFAFMF
jgi:outer membrane immunogenic protein